VNGHSLDFMPRDFSSPDLLRLTVEQQERLTEILDRYMRGAGARTAAGPECPHRGASGFGRCSADLPPQPRGAARCRCRFGRAAAEDLVDAPKQEPGRLVILSCCEKLAGAEWEWSTKPGRYRSIAG